MSTQQKTKGFTIIEVVLVLAIAGLIFLMVFIALPALQRSQRDSARKSELSTVLAAITTYQSNNRGEAPKADPAFGKYLDSKTPDEITLGSGTKVSKADVTFPAGTTTVDLASYASTDNIVFVMGAKCEIGSKVVAGSARQASAVVQLENGGGAYYCQTN